MALGIAVRTLIDEVGLGIALGDALSLLFGYGSGRPQNEPTRDIAHER